MKILFLEFPSQDLFSPSTGTEALDWAGSGPGLSSVAQGVPWKPQKTCGWLTPGWSEGVDDHAAAAKFKASVVSNDHDWGSFHTLAR